MLIFLETMNRALECKVFTAPPPQPPQPPQPPALEVGQFAVITGLQNRTDLNDLEAIVHEILPTGRVQVIWRKKDTPTPRVPPQLGLRL